ncbi:MAG TPA: D-alanyl-D-alanine carboxypeptidase/D-alanyl-D-alanine-endopeptidase [Chitinophagales bacterium]|nr:D-alanyl-D-alanine carboxypeptidase/D-alanyl-D-alanine-endopeptidase [Chitinophagales bacterium]HRK27075.1 D-alanyl-D-alanine carboxypeptidase/D-alanyl-D-alanine-endopeptidase [Chitinophagales bacterium]
MILPKHFVLPKTGLLIIALAVWVFWVQSALCQPKPVKYPTVQAALDRFDNDADLQTASWGYYVKRVNNGEVIAAANALKTLRPASALKVITTAAALTVLGAEQTFTTKIEYDGVIDNNGNLHGNLYITGGGDPTLATNRSDIAPTIEVVLKQWVAVVQKRGIKRVEGAIIGDAGFFPDDMIPRQWIWEDIGNYFGAGVSGLNFHENRYDLVLSSGKAGSVVKTVKIIPPVPNFTLINQLTAAGSTDEGYIFGAPYQNTAVARGTIPPNQSGYVIRGSVPEPAVFAAHNLQLALEQAGIAIAQPATSVRQLSLSGGYAKKERFMLHLEASPPVKKIVYWCNKRSVNLFAETLLRAMGKQQYGSGTVENGIKAVRQNLLARGIDVAGFIMQDGSGLSPLNAVSAKMMTDVLANYAQDAGFDDFYQSLPLAGSSADDGFLKSFMNTPAAAGKVRAKSGYISNNRAYCGYIKTNKGSLLAFTIMVNNYTCTNSQMKQKIEQLLLPLVQME